MKILHTADWHIGQLFHEYDRTNEHQQFLHWLLDTLQVEEVDVLLISGDVFDSSNPSAASIKMFYTFLNKAVKINPAIQIIITAGNHDSASRLESPKPLLESSNIHIIGLVEKTVDGDIDFEKLVIPIKDKTGVTIAWCLAVPFLRLGDYPAIAECENPYAEGVAALYHAAFGFVKKQATPNQPIIAMGHLHAQQAEVSDMDKSERLIMGGVECISAGAFPAELAYVALGHIHKAQRIGGKEHIRYCGSPLPMSFSEINYKHQVIVFDLSGKGISNLRNIEIPVTVALKRIPAVHSTLPEVLNSLQQLPAGNESMADAPYLEVRVLLDSPEPGLRHKIETVLQGKHVRLARIDPKYPASNGPGQAGGSGIKDNLHELKPVDVFTKIYQAKYGNAVPPELMQCFNQATEEVAQSESL